MYNYQSSAWIIVRGAWFFDFMSEVMRLMEAERDWTLKKIAATAYDSQLGRHHNWMLRKLIFVGMMTAKSRKHFLNEYTKEYKIVKKVDDVSLEQVYSDIKECSQLSKKMSNHIWTFLKTHKIEQIA